MKLVIFGATGAVGRHLVDQAPAQGFEVTAFARRPDKLGRLQQNLRVLAGDVRDPEAVAGAVKGQDVVLCTLGRPLLNSEKLRTQGTETIVRAMQQTGVRRLICLSALGAGDSRTTLPWYYRFVLMPLVMRRLYADHDLQEAFVRDSDLDWTLVRPGNFVEGTQTGAYRHGFDAVDRALRLKISRADVAHFMLAQLGSDRYLRQAPGLSY